MFCAHVKSVGYDLAQPIDVKHASGFSAHRCTATGRRFGIAMAALYAIPLADAAGLAAKRRRITSKRPGALYALPLADAAGPAAKRRRITSKRPDDAFRAEFGAAAVADELAHGEGAFLPVGVKRKLVHWTAIWPISKFDPYKTPSTPN